MFRTFCWWVSTVTSCIVYAYPLHAMYIISIVLCIVWKKINDENSWLLIIYLIISYRIKMTLTETLTITTERAEKLTYDVDFKVNDAATLWWNNQVRCHDNTCYLCARNVSECGSYRVDKETGDKSFTPWCPSPPSEVNEENAFAPLQDFEPGYLCCYCNSTHCCYNVGRNISRIVSSF